jgi:hypothetical protein
MSEQPTTGANAAKLRMVQLLLAKASDPAATAEESAVYMEKATELMAKYGIEEAMINEAKPAGEREQVTRKQIVIPAPYALEKRTLLNEIGKAFGVRTIHHSGTKPLRVTMFGYPSDLTTVEALFASLTLQATRDVLREEVPYWDNTAAFRRTFLVGFAAVVGRRLADMYRKVEREQTATTPGTALVLADRRQAVDVAFAEAFPRTTSQSRNLSGSGGRAGRAAGHRADLGGHKVGGGRRALG